MNRRGFVLVATVVVVAAAILVATGAIFAARATTANSRASDSDRRLRMAALDGVALVADALHNARTDVLAGKTPTIEPMLLVAGDDLDRIEVSAMPLFDGEFVQSEGAKIALEELSPEVMQALLHDQADAVVELAQRIVTARPLPSIDGCAGLADEGTQLRALRIVMGAMRTLGEREPAEIDEALPLMGLLTAHAREALVALDGSPRLDIVAATQESNSDASNSEGATAAPTAAMAQFDESEREALENAAKSSIVQADDNSIARELISRGVSLERVDALLNQCTTFAGATAPSRVDIVRADERVLAAIPGIGLEKAARIAGIGKEFVRLIPCDRQGAMRADLLAAQMELDRAQGHLPAFVCASVGTTGVNAIDPVAEIAAVCAAMRDPESGATPWLHVDAAMSGTAALCEEFRFVTMGAEHADSWCFNPHKWMPVNFDCDVLWIADRAELVRALSVLPEYLRNTATESGKVIDYRDWQIPLGRRFRALKLWFVLRSFGIEALAAMVRGHVAMAQSLAISVRANEKLLLVTEPALNLVAIAHRDGDEATQRLIDAVNRSGSCFVSHCRFHGQLVLRVSIGALATTQLHVDTLQRLLEHETAS